METVNRLDRLHTISSDRGNWGDRGDRGDYMETRLKGDIGNSIAIAPLRDWHKRSRASFSTNEKQNKKMINKYDNRTLYTRFKLLLLSIYFLVDI